MKIIGVWGISYDSLFFYGLSLKPSHFVSGAGSAFIKKLLIGLAMGNGVVISVTPIGTEIAS